MKIRQREVPVNEDTKAYIREDGGDNSSDQEEKILEQAMQEVLERYSALSPELQNDIVEDIKNQRDAGVGYKEISERVKLLVQKAEELEGMKSVHSDKYYVPKKTIEEQKLQEEVDSLIKELEERRKRKEEKEGEENLENNDGEKSEEDKKEWVN